MNTSSLENENVDIEMENMYTDSLSTDSIESQNTSTIEEASVEEGILTCPRCGANLLLRTAKRGANVGQSFYGCSNYPKCRYIKNI